MHRKRDLREWGLLAAVLLLGMVFMLIAGQVALRLQSLWQVNADMGSNIDPDSQYANVHGTLEFEPIQAGILTPAAWSGNYLTPQTGNDQQAAVVPLSVLGPTSTPFGWVASPTPTATATATVTPTATATATATVTNTRIYIPPTRTSTHTPNPPPANPPIPTPVPTINPYPNINFGPPDRFYNTIPDGAYATFYLGTPITSHGNDDADFVYYELAAGIGILLDHVVIYISTNGTDWHTVFYWGDGAPDTNSNVDITVIGGGENDNRDISAGLLINNTGVWIDIHDLGLTDSYRYIRIYAPPSGAPDGCDVDAIEVVP